MTIEAKGVFMGVMPDLNTFSVMSFDCYGTMIDWETGILGEIRPWLESKGIRPSDSEILTAFGLAESTEEAESPAALYPEILRGVHQRLAARWEVPADPEAAAAFGASVGRWPAFPDSHDALTRLGERYRLVILSNVDRQSFSKSQALLDVDFDAIYTAEEIGSYKPDSRNFLHLVRAEAAAGFSSHDILHVGQSLFHDHVPASEAGLATCWIQRPTGAGDHGAARPPAVSPRIDFHYTSLAELAFAAGV